MENYGDVSTFPQNMADAKRNTMINFLSKGWNFTLVYQEMMGKLTTFKKNAKRNIIYRS
jgi:hypothetical protein